MRKIILNNKLLHLKAFSAFLGRPRFFLLTNSVLFFKLFSEIIHSKKRVQTKAKCQSDCVSQMMW
ncbi:hypothetical protein BpHYR1_033346 [Brachionus plicatilis]|uniref:Uncharacterized protein n=1 Tax=Brachionus plicatilis TaxID=10195 RepID=A0A3M7PCY0_BRAPC|nr:hypothetical protein BpHYR1_033346 [Brachionus plicatilis]